MSFPLALITAMDISRLKAHIFDIIGAIHEVHRELGPGLNEFCYQEGLEIEFTERGIPFLRELSFHSQYHGKEMKAIYKLDFLCKSNIIVECKSVTDLTNIHRAQLYNYMHLTKSQCGILVNFLPPFATIERYFYDEARNSIITVNGAIIQQHR